MRAGLDSSTIHGVNGLRPAEALRLGRYVFKAAETSAEHEQLHRLNYETFVREVPQHDDTGDGKLVDKFHDKNRYFVALEGERVVGMLSAHDRPPFSIADKLADPGLLDRIGPRPLEVRLLAVEPRHRNGVVFSGLCVAVLRHAQRHGYSHMLISGVADRLRLYERMGFESLGPAVQQGGARFVPMVARVDGMPSQILDEAERLERKGGSASSRIWLGIPSTRATIGTKRAPPC
ncbi:MAG TPA: GNAT family N-acetyltransferase, partial [Planctomycetota bacterium]|nr:GNAT family N-acetyltransferase [Planctomycetota bacterium]